MRWLASRPYLMVYMCLGAVAQTAIGCTLDWAAKAENEPGRDAGPIKSSSEDSVEASENTRDRDASGISDSGAGSEIPVEAPLDAAPGPSPIDAGAVDASMSNPIDAGRADASMSNPIDAGRVDAGNSGECPAGFGDCTTAPGCETDLTSDPQNCGSCGVPICSYGCSESNCDHAIEVVAGGCALMSSGNVACWGANTSGQTGNGTDAFWQRFPKKVRGVGGAGVLGGVVDVTASGDFRCAALIDGRAVCWGSSQHYQLGHGSNEGSNTPVYVKISANVDITGVVKVGSGNQHACAVTSSKNVYCWGWNLVGAVGQSTATEHVKYATAVPGVGGVGLLGSVEEVVGGTFHTCARLTDGRVVCWGRNGYRELGTSGGSSSTPVQATALTGVVSLSSGGSTTCAVTSDKLVKCWGINQLGEAGVGNKDVVATATPVRVSAGAVLTDVVEIDVAYGSACARTGAGLFCWGQNSAGELALPSTTTEALYATRAASTPAFSKLGENGGEQHCGISAGTPYCWGAGHSYGIGDGTETDSSIPTRVLAPP